jgi:endonuclease YncB( thermonuclease family)
VRSPHRHASLDPAQGAETLASVARGGVRAARAGVVAAALALPAAVAFAGDVYDGDTIEIEGQRARLYGIDAFELGQTCLDKRGRPWRCGIAAKAALAERIEGQALQCIVLDEDPDGWYLSRCVGEDGTDLGAYMVRSGLALADKNAYSADEADARRRRAGAWEGQFMPPWEWRANGR